MCAGSFLLWGFAKGEEREEQRNLCENGIRAELHTHTHNTLLLGRVRAFCNVFIQEEVLIKLPLRKQKPGYGLEGGRRVLMKWSLGSQTLCAAA